MLPGKEVKLNYREENNLLKVKRLISPYDAVDSVPQIAQK